MTLAFDPEAYYGTQPEEEKMDDMSEAYATMNEEKRERHALWKIQNLKAIKESGLPHKIAGGETILFRIPGKPKVDFYPSTGRWRIPGEKKTFRGGAKSFISWYRKQNETI